MLSNHFLTQNILTESPRWLLATNDEKKMQKARGILEKAAKKNGTFTESTQKHLDVIVKPLSEEEIKKKKEGQLGFLDLFRYPILRRRALIMYFNWFTNR